MNENNLRQIFSHYIDRFDELNNADHAEYYKWQIAHRFHHDMDQALRASNEEFSAELRKIRMLTENLIDSYTQPFYGLVKFAEEEPDTVKMMFQNLFEADSGDLIARRNRIRTFLKQSHALRDKYCPGSYLYNDDFHSVTGYLFLYDPNNNYLFKSSHARAFADCIEFYEDWGTGESIALDVYYHMCDQLVEAIKSSEPLMNTDARRFSNTWGVDPMTLHPDAKKHILAFDIIYCSSAYQLFDGISYRKPSSKELKQYSHNHKKAQDYYQELQSARSRAEALSDALELRDSFFAEGTIIHHKTFGDGIIKKNFDGFLSVSFANRARTMSLGASSILSGNMITFQSNVDADQLKEISDLLKNEQGILYNLAKAEENFSEYAGFL